MTVLRRELLNGRTVVVAGDTSGLLESALTALGATVVRGRGEAGAGALVYDARGAFGAGGEAGLRAAIDDAWQAISAVANEALIPGGAAKVVLVGPRPDAGPFAEAARAGLENLVRTLSVEWARYGITTAIVAPGAATTENELAELVCFLVSPGGEYLSGSRVDLGAVGR
jgi:hypothetical protein